MDYAIAEATVEDVELLASLIRESFATVAQRFDLTPESAPRHPSNCTAEWVVAAFEKGIRHFILSADGVAAGCVALERPNDEVCYLERLAVLPAYRRRGFGEALVNHAVDKARQLGARRVELGMVAAQTELREWYESLGFAMTNIVQFEGVQFEVGFMRKVLVDETPAPTTSL